MFRMSSQHSRTDARVFLPGFSPNYSQVMRVTVLLLFLASLATAQQGEATGPTVFLSTDAMFRPRGEVEDKQALHAVLGELGVLPAHDSPTVVMVRSVDAYWSDPRWDEAVRERELGRIQTITSSIAAHGGEPPIFVAAPDGTESNMAQRVSMFGYDVSYFPSTAEELTDLGLDWLANPKGFELRWDREGRIAEQISQRWLLFGEEQVGALDMVLCVDREQVLGWARAFHDLQATDASLGRFVERCVSGEVSLDLGRTLPAEVLERYGLEGQWFALLLPRYTYPWLEEVVDLGEQFLSLANSPVSLRLVAMDTVSSDYERFIPADEHAGLLADEGVAVDAELSRSLPGWVHDYATGGVSLLLFDDGGSLVGSFFASNATISGIDTLATVLFEVGLY